MKRKSFMLIAGEPSGDLMAAELVQALRLAFNQKKQPLSWDYQPLHTSLEPIFFGAGGPQMAQAGVEIVIDLTAHSVIGLSEVIRNYPQFRRFFSELYHLALQREPDVILCVDFSGFNRRFAHAIKQYCASRQDWFHDWKPKIIQYVSPQVWASRESRVYQIARDFDLVLSTFPFEPEWYAARVPQLKVEYVGNPVVDRYARTNSTAANRAGPVHKGPNVLLLPGSRRGELVRHIPVLLGAMERVRREFEDARAQMILPNERLRGLANRLGAAERVQVQVGDLDGALQRSDVAIASTGTVTLECAYFGVPTVALYKTSWITWQVAKRIVTVQHAAMPNLLAHEAVVPEFIQDAATAENIGKATLELLRNEKQRQRVKEQLRNVITSLGPPGAAQRAAEAVLKMVS